MIKLTDPNPSQVMPIPSALRGGKFTNSAARMQKTFALDYSTRRSIERYKGARIPVYSVSTTARSNANAAIACPLVAQLSC
jgi:hypothetical protein